MEIQKTTQVFNDPRMIITFDDSKQQYIVNLNNINCAEFQINDNDKVIVIKSIYRCAKGSESVGTGKYIVDKLVALSKEKGYELEVEVDVSRLVVPPEIMPNTTIPLKNLYVLSKGQSWYNSMGFYESNYASNQKHIHDYLSTTIEFKMNGKTRQRVAEHRSELKLLLPTGNNTVEKHFSAMFSDITPFLI